MKSTSNKDEAGKGPHFMLFHSMIALHLVSFPRRLHMFMRDGLSLVGICKIPDGLLCVWLEGKRYFFTNATGRRGEKN